MLKKFFSSKGACYFVFALAAGLALLFISGGLNKDKSDSPYSQVTELEEYEICESRSEKKIEEMLTALNGVSSAQVLLTVNEAPEKGARPSVRGVSVIYSGSDTSDIKLKITMLVSTAFGITSDKIYVTCK